MPAPLEKVTWMTEAWNRGTIFIHCIKLTLITVREGRNVIEQNARVDAWTKLDNTEDHKGFLAVARFGDELLERIP